MSSTALIRPQAVNRLRLFRRRSCGCLFVLWCRKGGQIEYRLDDDSSLLDPGRSHPQIGHVNDTGKLVDPIEKQTGRMIPARDLYIDRQSDEQLGGVLARVPGFPQPDVEPQPHTQV